MTSTRTANSKPVLIAGGLGKTGDRVAAGLSALDRPFRAASRSTTPTFDWEDQSTWSAALDGVRSAYVAYQPDVAVPGAVDTLRQFFGCLRDAGGEYVVFLSGRGEAEAEQAEQALVTSGLDWTILRASWFFQNFSESFFAPDIARGFLVVPDSLAPEPFVDADDIAEIAVLALTDAKHRGKLYEISGPQALTFAEVAGAIGAVTGREIAYSEVPLAEYLALLGAYGVPADVTALIGYLFSTVLDGRNTPLATGVQEAIGRAPTNIADFAHRAQSGGAWSVAP